MKTLTFSEFFDLPPGVIFGQDYALPHRDAGLWRKGESYPEDDDGWRGVMAVDILAPEGEGVYCVGEDAIEDDHRFLVYEPADLGRLAGIVEDARKVAQP